VRTCWLDVQMDMRTTIEIDDELMRPALAASGLRTRRAVTNPVLQRIDHC
jgi:Arc/MetJ family transcription regulator